MKLNISKELGRLIESYPSATKEQNNELLNKYHNDNDLQARETLILHNMRMVLHAICNQYSNVNVNHNDLFITGLIGLIAAIDEFKVNTNNSLTTVAYFKIKKQCNRYLTNNATLIRFPNIITETSLPNKLRSGATIEEVKRKHPQYNKIPDTLINAFRSYEIIYPSNEKHYEIVGGNSIEAEYQKKIKEYLKKNKDKISPDIYNCLDTSNNDTMYEEITMDHNMEIAIEYNQED